MRLFQKLKSNFRRLSSSQSNKQLKLFPGGAYLNRWLDEHMQRTPSVNF